MVRRGIGGKGAARSGPRGVAVVVFFLITLAATSGLAGSLLSSGLPLPQERPPSPLDRAKIAFAGGDLAAAQRLLGGLEGDEGRTLLAKVHLKRGRLGRAREIQRSLDQSAWVIVQQVVVGTQYRDTGFQNGQVYRYKVTAVDDALDEAH